MAVRKLPKPGEVSLLVKGLSAPLKDSLDSSVRTNLTASAAAAAVADPNSPDEFTEIMTGPLKSAAEIISLSCLSQFARSPQAFRQKRHHIWIGSHPILQDCERAIER